MGQLFAYLAPTAAVATVLGGVNHFLWNIFNGFLVPSPIMARGWVWLNWISATTYVIYGLAASQLGQNERKMLIPNFSGAHRLLSAPSPALRVFLFCAKNVCGHAWLPWLISCKPQRHMKGRNQPEQLSVIYGQSTSFE